ncbi:MAG: hypothetical protein ACJ71J_17170 [Nitrososphaeraceae archaeon]
MSLSCRQCGKPIKFDDKWVSERTCKKIPLDPGTNESHDCPVRRDHLQQQQQGQQLQQPNSSKKKGDIINVTKVAASKFSG